MEFSPKLLKNLVLVGMPGAGKTSVGQELAKRLGTGFTDSDQLIEARQGLSIPEIFARNGEAAFRQLEHEALVALLAGPAQVISTGGGAFVQPANHDLMLQNGLVLWLRADLDLLARRTARRSNRPLLQGGNPRAKLEALLATREPVYRTAHAELWVDDRPVEETAQRALALLTPFLEPTLP